MNEGGDMKKTRLIFLLCALTAAAWSLPGLAQARSSKPAKGSKYSASPSKIVSAFDGGSSAFDGGSSAFDG
jgi:hypothetical protein